MSIRLLVRQRSEAGGADAPQELVLSGAEITIGRDKSCAVQLSQMAVSRHHARIIRDGALCFVEDLGSAYGTQVNGRPLPKGEKRLLREGDLIAVAQYDLTFDRASETNPVAEKTNAFAKAALKKALRGLSAHDAPFFRMMNGPLEGQKFPLEEAQEMIVGREEGVELVLGDDLVSRRHAKLRRDLSGVHVEDLGSRNGLLVNGKRVQRKTLRDQDEIEIGATRLLFIDPHAVREPGSSRVSLAESSAPKDPSEKTSFEPDPPSQEMAAPSLAPIPKPPGAEEVLDVQDAPSQAPPHEGVEEPAEEEAPPQPFFLALLNRLKNPRVLVPVAVMGGLLLLGLVLIIALLAGA